jgi:hypothetical protein
LPGDQAINRLLTSDASVSGRGKDILIKYKQESGGPLDYTNSGFTNGDCQRSDVADSHAQNGK